MDPIDVILKHEGGFTDHPNDRGNWYKGKLVGTNYGITGATLARWIGRDVTMEDVRNLDVATAKKIYQNQYLVRPKIHTLPNPPQDMILDMSINHGPTNAIRMMQKVINLAGFGPISVDGRIGPMTIQAAQRAAASMGPYFQNAIVDERVSFYHRIVNNNPKQGVFLKGWLRRANSFRLPTPGSNR